MDLSAVNRKRNRFAQSGQGLTEYALLLALVAVVVIAALTLLGDSTALGFKRTLDGFQGQLQTVYTDLFDEEPLLEWQQIWGRWTIENGRFTSSDRWSKVVTALPVDDYTFSLDLQTTATRGDNIWDVTRVVFRFADTDNYYAIVPKTDGVMELAKMQNGQWHSWLAYANTGADPLQSQNFQVTVEGAHIQVWQNGQLYIDYTDPNPIPSGGVGVSNDWSEGAMDNVQITVSEQP
ncbi:MAG: DUF1080 domain-containing protein [Chloroflexi bacterium]|nr:MAG: DUF1080 domain-containing protein [Chloroflexota bacterium]